MDYAFSNLYNLQIFQQIIRGFRVKCKECGIEKRKLNIKGYCFSCRIQDRQRWAEIFMCDSRYATMGRKKGDLNGC